ncbi:MAG TPA: tetratricopeptide repeat protein [Verrucomicrobiae bacterium]
MESKVAELPLSHKAWAWFEKNQKQAVMGAAIVVAVGLVVWFLAWKRAETQVQAANALSNVAVSSTTGGGQETTPQAYLKITADYPNSKAAARALLLAAGGLFTEGKYADAQAQFERFTREYRSSDLLGEALVGIASCLEAQGKVDQAVTAYKELISRHPADSVIPQAKFSLGGLYEVQKRPELARDMYEQVERESRMSILGSEAGMRLEELAEKNPNLAAAALTPAPAAPIQLSVPTGTNPAAQAPKK